MLPLVIKRHFITCVCNLHASVLYNTWLHCILLSCIITVHRIASHCTVVHWSALHSNSLHCTVVQLPEDRGWVGDGGDSEESLVRPAGWLTLNQALKKANIHFCPSDVFATFGILLLFNLIWNKNWTMRDSVIKIVLHEQVLTFLSLAKLFSFFNAVRWAHQLCTMLRFYCLLLDYSTVIVSTLATHLSGLSAML